MANSQAFDGYLKQKRNPKSMLSEAEGAAFQWMRERRFEQIAKELGRIRDSRPADLIKKLRGDTNEIVTEAFPDFVDVRKRVVDKYKPEIEKARGDIAAIIWDDLDVSFGGEDEGQLQRPAPPPPAVAPGGIGEFWWDQTTYFSTFREISIEEPDEFIRIFGHLHWDGDSLITGTVGFIQDFALTPDRFPNTTKTSFLIRTSLRNIGVVSGLTALYDPLFAADDKWCKCQWFVKARVFLPSSLVGVPLTLDADMAQPLGMHLVNVSPFGQENALLSGSINPVLMFNLDLPALASTGTPLLLQVESRFNIQLEGETDIWFRGSRGSKQQSVPSLQNAVRFQSQPIKLE